MIEIKNLTKRFEKTVAINNLNCEISEGMIFGLAGSNGSGKVHYLEHCLEFMNLTRDRL